VESAKSSTTAKSPRAGWSCRHTVGSMAELGGWNVLQQRLLQRLMLLLGMVKLMLVWLLVMTLGWRGVDHEVEALFGRRELRNVVVRMSSTDVFLHGAISLFTDATLATARAILIPQRTDDLAAGVDDGERRGQRRSGWCHGW
jgi:hypothetical protein